MCSSVEFEQPWGAQFRYHDFCRLNYRIHQRRNQILTSVIHVRLEHALIAVLGVPVMVWVEGAVPVHMRVAVGVPVSIPVPVSLVRTVRVSLAPFDVALLVRVAAVLVLTLVPEAETPWATAVLIIG